MSSYEVIARKWRPKVFDELVGQHHISQTILNSMRGGRLPHAILLTGPRGTGKTSTARIIAKSLRCPNAKDFVPCNTCSECEDISSSRSVGVMEIDGASNNGVDDVRVLRDSVAIMPASGKYKVYIIDEVHMLSGSAFNALLKTLEEPPPHVTFIMATTEVQKIPNTVLSRCQRYDFRKISTKMIAEHLESICKKEKISVEKEAVWAVAKQGDGSMRDSQSLLDQVINFCEGKMTLAKVSEVLGLTDRGLIVQTVDALLKRDNKAVVQVIEAVFSSGYDPILFMKDLLEELRHLVVLKIAPAAGAQIVDLPQEEMDRLSALAAPLSEEDIHLLFDMALKGAGDLYRAQDARVVLEMVLLRMSIAPRIRNLLGLTGIQSSTELAPNVSTTTMVTNRDPTHPSTQAPQPQVRAARTETAPTPAAPTGNTLNEKWTEFVDRVRKVNGLVAAQLDQLHLLAINGSHVEVGVPEKYKFLMNQINDPAFHKKLLNYLNTFWGPGHTVTIKEINPQKSESLSPVQVQEKKKEDEAQEVARKVEEHPLVRQAKTIFNTQIKSIRENS